MMIQEALYAHVTQYLKANPSHRLYGLFDGVKYPMLWSDLEEGVLAYDMLFREAQLREDLESVAPYFVTLDFESEAGKEQSKALLACYGENGSIFMASASDDAVVLEALCELFYVYTPNGDKGYMRFYEPKIFRNYIAQKDDNICYALFSEVACYWCEDVEDVSTVHQYIKESTYTYDKKSISLKEKELQADA